MRPRLSRSDPALYRPVSFRPPAPNALYAFRKTRRTDGPPYLNGPTFCMAFSGPADNIRDTGHGSRTESLPRSGERPPPETDRPIQAAPAPNSRSPRPKPAKDRAPRPSPETRYRSRRTSSILRPAQFSRIARSEAKPAIRLPQHGNVSRKRQAPSCRTEKRFRPTFIGPNA